MRALAWWPLLIGIAFLGCNDSGGSGGSGSSSATSGTGSGGNMAMTPTTMPPPAPPMPPTPPVTPPAPPQVLATGSFSALSYNVAGLPQGLSGSNPTTNIPLISPLLNAYDLVLVQEDFAYHIQLATSVTLPHHSATMAPTATLAGDGLNRFTLFGFTGFDRQQWNACHGLTNAANDCLSAKGFSFARHELTSGVEVDVYNLHCDAGGSQGDVTARNIQVAQLVAYINFHSAGRAVIVGGDTNMHGFDPEDEPTIQDLLLGAGLEDVARTLGMPEHIDRFLFKDGDHVLLEPTVWRVADEFVDANGADLSDHPAIHVEFDWSLIN